MRRNCRYPQVKVLSWGGAMGVGLVAHVGVSKYRSCSDAAKERASGTQTQAPPEPHPADTHDFIEVRGARENNLKDISLRIPKRRLTVFTGVSGSGKSSLVFGTIAAESQRMINETYSAFVQGFMPTLARPDVDVLSGITTAIIVDQERMGANARSTVGTATDANAMLRILFSRLGQPHVGSPQAFSFNVPSVSGAGAVTFERSGVTTKERKTFSLTGGMCPRCDGMGSVTDIDLAQLFDETKSLADGAITIPGYTADGWYVRDLHRVGLPRPGQAHPRLLQAGTARLPPQGADQGQARGHQHDLRGPGAQDPEVHALQGRRRDAAPHPGVRRAGGHLRDVPGVRRDAAERGCARRRRSAACRSPTRAPCRSATSPSGWAGSERADGGAASRRAQRDLLDSFVEIGLGYLSLDRPAGTLSGGEAQRTKMIRHLGSSLTDVTYVFDEPTIGLHPHDIRRMNDLLLRLRDKGNTVLVVEHKPEVISIADHVVDLGPGAGRYGGEIQFEGTVDALRASGTLTGRHLDHRAELRPSPRTRSGVLEIRGASQHNLRNVDVDIPVGVLTVVTGVAGSGKTSLVHGNLEGREGVIVVDQTAIGGSRRSNPATYTGLLDVVRKDFAKANGVKPALFSANSEGACPVCKGLGMILTDLGPMATVSSVCEECGGKRFTDEVLELRLRGKNIAEVLDMSVAEALEFFPDGSAGTTLRRLSDVGLPYLGLGQALNTLSGGERQRLKLAIHMAKKTSTYVLDEPTAGLHLADVDHLLALLDRLVDDGNTVIVIEHHQAVMAHADWIIDLGPGAGHDGGLIVFEGTPEALVSGSQTLTATHLREYIAH